MNIKGTLKIFNDSGMVARRKININEGESYNITEEFLRNTNNPKEGMHWYTVESLITGLQAFTIITNNKTKVSSGEHNF